MQCVIYVTIKYLNLNFNMLKINAHKRSWWSASRGESASKGCTSREGGPASKVQHQGVCIGVWSTFRGLYPGVGVGGPH